MANTEAQDAYEDGFDDGRKEAADEIEALRAEVERLRELLSEADRLVVWETVNVPSDFQGRVEDALQIGRTRAALAEKE